MLCNPSGVELSPADGGMLHGFGDATILPLIDMDIDQYHHHNQNQQQQHHNNGSHLSSEFMVSQTIRYEEEDQNNHQQYGDPELSTADDVYPQGNKQLVRMFTEEYDFSPPHSEWTTKPIGDWDESDIRSWILEAAGKRANLAELASFDFADVTGAQLLEMSAQSFCGRMHSQTNPLESRSIAEYLYKALRQMIAEQEAIVPTTVSNDRFGGQFAVVDEQHLLDLDGQAISYKAYELDYGHHQHHHHLSNHHQEFLPGSRIPNCDSGYNSFSEEYESKVVDGRLDSESLVDDVPEEASATPAMTKRPPGRPKGSGKKHPKRIKNVSVPEFLRDLLLDPEFCPRIIKWEDYAAGKFRFVRPDEVAKLWGSKRKNEKMSFEKFSRAMRYHYKQGVLVSVPTARLVYQFGRKAPPYTTPNPNFDGPPPTMGKYHAVR